MGLINEFNTYDHDRKDTKFPAGEGGGGLCAQGNDDRPQALFTHNIFHPVFVSGTFDLFYIL